MYSYNSLVALMTSLLRCVKLDVLVSRFRVFQTPHGVSGWAAPWQIASWNVPGVHSLCTGEPAHWLLLVCSPATDSMYPECS